MSFASVLESYCTSLNCTNVEIAQQCGISASSLSRYRNGSRVPTSRDAVENLARGIAELSSNPASDGVLAQAEVAVALDAARKGLRIVGMSFGERLNKLMSTLGLHNADIARIAKVDPSYISRIRSGDRTPTDPESLARVCANLAAHRCLYDGALEQVSSLVKKTAETAQRQDPGIDLEAALQDDIMAWLLGGEVAASDIAETRQLFDWIDQFDFASYVAGLQEPVDVPEPDLTPRSWFSSEKSDMRKAELEFLNIAAYTHASDVYLVNDMPLPETVADHGFLSEHARAVERTVRNGANVHVVHSSERPFAESIIILRDWMPLYMTGRVTPHFLWGLSNRVFYHENCVCDTCALSAEAVLGHQSEGRHFLSLLPDDIAYYQRKIGFIMERVVDLFEVYLENRPGDFERFEEAERKRLETGTCREVCEGMYKNLRIRVYPGDCAVLSISGGLAAHFVVRQAKLRYAISLMN